GGGVPGQSELFPVDLAADREPRARIAPGVLDDAAEFDLHHNFLRGTADGKVAMDVIGSIVVDVVDPGQNECQLGEFRCVEEIGRFQMAVALLVLCIDGCDVCGKGYFGGREVFVFGGDIGGKGRKSACNGGDHQVLHFELDFGVCRVQHPFCGSHFTWFNVSTMKYKITKKERPVKINF